MSKHDRTSTQRTSDTVVFQDSSSRRGLRLGLITILALVVALAMTLPAVALDAEDPADDRPGTAGPVGIEEAPESRKAPGAKAGRLFHETAIENAAKAVVEETGNLRMASPAQAEGGPDGPGFVDRYLVPQNAHQLAYLGCTAFDAGTTAVALSRGAKELNPLIEPAPEILMPTLKVAHYLLARWLDNRNPSASDRALWLPSTLLYCGIGAWNTSQIAKLE